MKAFRGSLLSKENTEVVSAGQAGPNWTDYTISYIGLSDKQTN